MSIRTTKILIILSLLLLIVSPQPAQTQTEENIKVFFVESFDEEKVPISILTDAGKSIGDFRQIRVNTDIEIEDMLTGDLNRDGITDIIVMNEEAKIIRVYIGDKNLTFNKQYKYNFSQIGNRFIGIGDFDGNNKLDIAIENSTSNKPITIFRGKGNGRLLKKQIALSTQDNVFGEIGYSAIVDINNDGKLDILAMDFSGELFAFINKGKAKFVAKNQLLSSIGSFAAGDFDGDKMADCFGYKWTDDKVYFYKGNGDGTFVKKSGFSAVEGGIICDLYAAYINKDNKLDLLGQGKIWGGNSWAYLGKGNGKLTKKKYLPGNGTLKYGAVLTDISGNGKTDLAAAEGSGMWYYTGKGTGKFNSPKILGEGLDFASGSYQNKCVGSGDFNKDGKMDIVGNNYSFIDSNLIIFLGGTKPATLTISNLSVSRLELVGSNIYFDGSYDYTGTDTVFKYLQGENNPTKSTYIRFRVRIDLPYPIGDIYVTYYVTGNFLSTLDPNSGTVTFNLELGSPVTVSGYSPTVSRIYFSMYDYNLVRSNLIE